MLTSKYAFLLVAPAAFFWGWISAQQFNENDEILALAHYLDTVVVYYHFIPYLISSIETLWNITDYQRLMKTC